MHAGRAGRDVVLAALLATVVWLLPAAGDGAAVLARQAEDNADQDQAASDERARDIDEACPPDEIPAADLADRDDLSDEERPAVDCIVHFRLAEGRDGSYLPDEDVRRDQMATFIARSLMAAGHERPPAHEVPDAFDDDDPCPDGDEECAREGGHTTPAHERNIDWLAQLGIVSGDEAGRFHATRPVRRDQMASFVNRGIEVLTGAAAASGPDRFAHEDCPEPHDVHVDGLADVGIVQGKGDGTYGCADPVDRGQMALFLARNMDYLVEEEGQSFAPLAEVALVLSTTTLVRGAEATGTVGASDATVTRLTVDGCGHDNRVLYVADDGTFRVDIPAGQPPGQCTLAFTVESQGE